MSRSAILNEEIAQLQADKGLESMVSDSANMLETFKLLQEAVAEDQPYDLSQVESAFKGWHTKAVKHEKKVHKSLRNYGEKTEKLFPFELDNVYHYRKIELGNDETETLIDKAIVMELLRKGKFDIGKQFCKESGIDVGQDLEKLFWRLHFINEQILGQFDLAPAIQWATNHSDELRQIGSDLEFCLHKIQYQKMLQSSGGDPFEAYKYAQEEFPRFMGKHFDMIAKLVGSLAFESNKDIAGLSSAELVRHISRDYCALAKMSAQSPLYNLLLSSYMALPAFKKYYQITKSSNNLSWTTANELPFEITLPRQVQFHSVFICPVSKEETTVDNPPMVLPCRHLLSSESLKKLSKNGIASFKCPYCPKTCLATQAKAAHFVNL